LDLPIVAEDYIHRIGRTGRAGASGDRAGRWSAPMSPATGCHRDAYQQLLKRVKSSQGFEPVIKCRSPPTGGQF